MALVNLFKITHCTSVNLRREDDGLADHLALGVCGDIDSVGVVARSAADEIALVGAGPATMADAGFDDFVGVGVCGGTGKHTETLQKSVENLVRVF
jgi:hypothetical protein